MCWVFEPLLDWSMGSQSQLKKGWSGLSLQPFLTTCISEMVGLSWTTDVALLKSLKPADHDFLVRCRRNTIPDHWTDIHNWMIVPDILDVLSWLTNLYSAVGFTKLMSARTNQASLGIISSSVFTGICPFVPCLFTNFQTFPCYQ